MNKEIRTIDNIEFRAIEEDNKKFISGYALTFGKLSRDLGGFFETIEREAINDSTDLSNVVALFNHNPMYLLARKSEDVNTLELTVDSTGLFYRFEVDMEISYHKDLFLNIKRKNISKSSFAFSLPSDGSGEKWEKRDGQYIRTITKFKSIVDVSPVVTPAYEDTSVRNFDDIKTKLDTVEDTPIQIPIKDTHVRSINDFIYTYHKLNTK